MGVGHFVDYVRINSAGQPAVAGDAIYRAGAAVTTSYVAGNVIDAWKYDQLIIFLSNTKASLTSTEFIVEFSPDGTNWYQESAESISGGTATDRELAHTIVAANQSASAQGYRFAIPITDRYIRISVKGTGTVAASSVSLDVIVGIN